MLHRAGRIFLTVALALVAGAGARAQTPTAAPDLNKLADEAQGWLGDLVRINSVNPPGNEAAVAKYVSAIFQKEGISNEVLEMAPGRSIVVARLQAGPLPDPTNALLLVAHQDTVGVDAKKWTGGPVWRGHSRRIYVGPRRDRRQGHARRQHRHDGRAQAHESAADARRPLPRHRR